jgi:hypothetical protein
MTLKLYWQHCRYLDLNFYIWISEVISYNALNSELANFETPAYS